MLSFYLLSCYFPVHDYLPGTPRLSWIMVAMGLALVAYLVDG